uniref:Serine/threonine-protein kinase LMTK1 (Trinotate prediction) n=1 Tax=Henneguya salminicola TaxID=69463 RepID=A0A6G3ME67_HENSL
MQDSKTNYVLSAHSLIAVMYNNINKNSKINFDERVPFICMSSIELTPIEPTTTNIHFGKIETDEIHGYFRTLNPTSTLTLEEKCMSVVSEDSWEMIRNKYFNLNHCSLVRMIGIMFINDCEEKFPYSLLYDQTQVVDVSEYIKDCIKQNLPIKLFFLVDILTQVTSALRYIHKQEIVHGDMALRNVFIFSNQDNSDNPIVKLGDYAKFRPSNFDDYLFINNSEFTDQSGLPRTGLYLPVKWMAPEFIKDIFKSEDILKNNLCLPQEYIQVHTLSKVPGNYSGDIYSFGILVWELFHSGKKPHEEKSISNFIATAMKDYISPIIVQKNIGSIAKLVMDCTNHDPLKRSTMDLVVSNVRALSESFGLKI